MTSERTTMPPSLDRAAPRARIRFFGDVFIICCSVAAGQILFAGNSPGALFGSTIRINHTVVSVVLAALWIGLLAISRDLPRVTNRDVTDYLGLAAATLQLFGAIAVGSLLLPVGVGFGYLAATLLLGLGALLAVRWLWRADSSAAPPTWRTTAPRNPL